MDKIKTKNPVGRPKLTDEQKLLNKQKERDPSKPPIGRPKGTIKVKEDIKFRRKKYLQTYIIKLFSEFVENKFKEEL